MSMNVRDLREALGSELLDWVTAEADLGDDAGAVPTALADLEGLAAQIRGFRSARSGMPPVQASLGASFNKLRVNAGGALPNWDKGDDLVARQLCALAVDAYPLLLLHRSLPDSRGLPPSFGPVFCGHADRDFRAGVLADPQLGRIFPGDEPDDLSIECSIATNLGVSSGMQLAMLSSSILGNAAQIAMLRGDRSIDAFLDTAVDVLGTWRSLASTGRATVPLYLGFAGVSLPPSHACCQLSVGRLHAVQLHHLAYLAA